MNAAFRWSVFVVLAFLSGANVVCMVASSTAGQVWFFWAFALLWGFKARAVWQGKRGAA